MLVDEVRIEVKGGKGGDGKVHFDTSKMSQGPDGGNGGKGGSVFAVGVSDLSALNKFRFKKKFFAQDGENGMTKKKSGKNGDDLYLQVPVGTIIRNLDTQKDYEIIGVGEQIKIASGGKGGRGNYEFRSSVNISPKKAESGREGEYFNIFLELQLIAHVGFIGFPNAGKSSMLNELTQASAKVGNYKFTTLEPNLGVLDELILADIPGLIEGASTGKGLGIKFLRHIKRTKVLIHFISSESEDLLSDYQVIRNELASYNPDLLEKDEYIFLTKHDLFSKSEIQGKVKALKKASKNVLSVSIHDSESIEKVRVLLHKLAGSK